MVDEGDRQLQVAVAEALGRLGLARTAEELGIPQTSVLRITTGQRTRLVTRRLARANLYRVVTEARAG